MQLHFHFRQTMKPDFFRSTLVRNWLKMLAQQYAVQVVELNYIFTGDETLLQINLDYLHHNTYTDIITFNNSETSEALEGDIFISLERVSENAKKYKATYEKECIRVMAHGFLHLIGLNDKTPPEKKRMRTAEENAIKLYRSAKRKIKKP